MSLRTASLRDRIGKTAAIAVSDRALSIAAPCWIGIGPTITVADARITAGSAPTSRICVRATIAIGQSGLGTLSFWILAAGYDAPRADRQCCATDNARQERTAGQSPR